MIKKKKSNAKILNKRVYKEDEIKLLSEVTTTTLEEMLKNQNPVIEAININKHIFYRSVDEYLEKNADLPNWRNDSTPLNETNMWRINNEIQTKFDDVEINSETRKMNFKIDGANKKSIDINLISENNYSNKEKENVAKIDDIVEKLNTLSLDFGTF